MDQEEIHSGKIGYLTYNVGWDQGGGSEIRDGGRVSCKNETIDHSTCCACLFTRGLDDHNR
jgi:hypothetical protein